MSGLGCWLVIGALKDCIMLLAGQALELLNEMQMSNKTGVVFLY